MDTMRIKSEENIRRRDITSALPHLLDQFGRVELDAKEMRERILAEFTKKLDGKLKNLQECEGIVVTFDIDIVGNNGKIRGGSGSQRNMPEYIAWRSAVFERDSYHCVECGSGGKLNAHHIKPWSGHSELRFDVGNGATLCLSCHAEKHPHLKFIDKKTKNYS